MLNPANLDLVSRGRDEDHLEFAQARGRYHHKYQAWHSPRWRSSGNEIVIRESQPDPCPELPDRRGERVFLGVSALLFVASAAGTVCLCRTMSGGMPMPGGWTMSMVWMRMPGRSWPAAAAMFLAMWVVMMVAMMLPSLMPTLLSYRRTLQGLEAGRLGPLTAFAAAGYFLPWAVLGAGTYVLGVGLVAAEMRWLALARHAPLGTAAVVLLAGWFQLTAWKARRLGKCRNAQACNLLLSPNVGTAWRQGLMWGVDCVLCCCAFMSVLMVIGVMNLAAMIVLSVGITAERLLPKPDYASRTAGIAIVAAGAFLLAQALIS
jgi:predicted metal-binding membrane protein